MYLSAIKSEYGHNFLYITISPPKYSCLLFNAIGQALFVFNICVKHAKPDIDCHS